MIDSHCHIAGPEFVEDLRAVVQRARGAGLTRALVVLAAEDESEIARAGDVREAWPDARFAIGIHPHAAGKFGHDPLGAVRLVESRIAAEPGTRALGEIGLDYHYDFAPRPVQQHVFAEQVALATRLRIPLVIHSREAEDDTFRILKEHHVGEAGGVFHCFTGDLDMARRVLDIGFHISLAGIVTFSGALVLKEVARMVPLDRLLIETDSPFLAPVPHRGKRNEPAHVGRVAAAIADLRGIDVAVIAEVTATNFDRLFNP